MKIISKNSKSVLVLSQKEWETIGEKAGWADKHPLDVVSDSKFGIPIPEDNYYRRVWSDLTHILSDVREISEKSFSAYDKIMAEADSVLRKPEIMAVVEKCSSSKKRSSLCAEMIFDEILKS